MRGREEENAAGERIDAGGPHAREEYVDAVGREYDLGRGPVRIYGALAFRYWIGGRGQMTPVAGVYWLWEPVLLVDRWSVIEELHQAARRQISQGVHERTGLTLDPRAQAPEQTEWLEIWEAEADLVERAQAFMLGVSAMQPSGTRAQDMTGQQIGALTRRLGLHGPTKIADTRHTWPR